MSHMGHSRRSMTRLDVTGLAAISEQCGRLRRSWSLLAGVAVCAGPEGNNLVVDVMPNVSASQPWNPGPLAPVTGNLFFVHSEIRLVRSDAAAPAEHDARHPPDFGVTGNVKQRPINPVHCLPNLFQHKHMSVEVRLQRRAK